MAYCEQCGSKNIDGAAVCVECGAALPPSASPFSTSYSQPQSSFAQQPASGYGQPQSYSPPPNPGYVGQQPGYDTGYSSPAPMPANPFAASDPVTVGDWIVTTLLMCIPLVGFIMLFVWAFDSTTKMSKKNWARAALIWYAILIVLWIILGITVGSAILSIFSNIYW